MLKSSSKRMKVLWMILAAIYNAQANMNMNDGYTFGQKIEAGYNHTDVYILTTLDDVSLAACAKQCLTQQRCDFINYMFRSKMCFLIEHFNKHFDWKDLMLKKTACVLGVKAKWQTNIPNPDESSTVKAVCSAPPNVQHAEIHGNIFIAGSKVLYRCVKNPYKTTSVTCSSTGHWIWEQQNRIKPINCPEIFSSCHDVLNIYSNPSDDKYLIGSTFWDTFIVHCEFEADRIYTYIAKTNHTNINIGYLYNNGNEIRVRYKDKSGGQYEASYGQIARYNNRNMIVQYNSFTGAKPIFNPDMSPFIYVAMLNKTDVKKWGTYGYSVWGTDYTFTNCDGNENTYFALLLNANNKSYARSGSANQFMSHWKKEATHVAYSRYIDDVFFVPCEMHFGGCGGYMTCNSLDDIEGVTFGFRYGKIRGKQDKYSHMAVLVCNKEHPSYISSSYTSVVSYSK